MNLYYKIIEYYSKERLIVVRYYTDIITEEELKTTEEKKDGIPLRCSTDVSISIPLPEYTEFGMHKYLIQRAPIQTLKKLELEKIGSDEDFSIINTEKLFGKIFSQTEEKTHILKTHIRYTDEPIQDKETYITPVSNTTLLVMN